MERTALPASALHEILVLPIANADMTHTVPRSRVTGGKPLYHDSSDIWWQDAAEVPKFSQVF